MTTRIAMLGFVLAFGCGGDRFGTEGELDAGGGGTEGVLELDAGGGGTEGVLELDAGGGGTEGVLELDAGGGGDGCRPYGTELWLPTIRDCCSRPSAIELRCGAGTCVCIGADVSYSGAECLATSGTQTVVGGAVGC